MAVYVTTLVLLVTIDIGWWAPASFTVIVLVVYCFVVRKRWAGSGELIEALEPVSTFLRSFVATMLSIALFPVFVYLWFVLVYMFSSAFVIGRWDQASWWQPFASFGLTMLFLIIGGVLLAADVFVGVWVGGRLERWCGDR